MGKCVFLHLIGIFILIGGIYLSLTETGIGVSMAIFGGLLLGAGSYLIPNKKAKRQKHQ